ncbi:MAG: TonB-dependent receptor [Cellvibrionales bacterium]|jgi:iron complex outermembrane receptor protein
MKKHPLAVAVLAGIVGATASVELMAQDLALEEVVVTARKRTENLQDVGFSISALSQSEIEGQFARDITDLANISPNIVIDDTAQGPGGVAAIFIRGVGVADVEKNFDPAVGVVVDGMFIGSNAGSLLRSIDLASMEVLRGPQGTLFGRNTIGGIINITRTQPTGELGGKIRAGYEEYDTYYMDGVFNFGLGENLGVKLTGAKRDQREGYYDNDEIGRDVGRNDYQSFGANILWSPTENLELEYTGQFEETDQDTPPLLNTGQPRHLFCSAYGYCSPGLDSTITGDRRATANIGYAPPDPGDQVIAFSTPDQAVETDMAATFDADTHIIEARWQATDAISVDYIYGSYETDETIISNWDGTPDFLYGTTRPATYEQTSHELRLGWDNGGAINAVLGAYLWESEYEIPLRSWVGFVVPGLILDILQNSRQESESEAIFADVDWQLTDSLTLNFGGRYTKDDKSTEQTGNVNAAASESWSEFTPRASLRYQLNDGLMTYVTYSSGYRSGGFNGRVNSVEEAVQPYDPETVDNFELGFKHESDDNRLRFNGAVFYMVYDDKQEELQLPSDTGTGQKTVVTNASEAEIWGIELEAQAVIGNGLTLRANIGYLDTEYDSFGYTDLQSGQEVDFSYLEFRRAPDLTGTVDATYEWPTASGRIWVRGAYHYLGEHYVNVTNAPELKNDGQHLLDASVNWEINDLRLSVFGRNLSDEDGYTHGYDVAGLWSYAATRPPRTIGAEVVWNFGN